MGDCSTVNNEFWNKFSSQIMKTLTPTQVSLPDPTLLLQRLRASTHLQPLFALSAFESTAESAMWKCGAVNDGDTIIVILLPRRFYWNGDVTESALLPILLLQYTLDLNLDLSTSQHVDAFLHFDLTTTPSFAEVPSSMKRLLTQLSSLHTTCYLQLVDMALREQWVLSSHDFLAGLQVCQSTTLSLDLTPLVAGLCNHAVTWFPATDSEGSEDKCEERFQHPPILSETLCRILTSALSKRMWTCSVRMEEEVKEADSKCDLHTQQVNQALQQCLQELGFRPVPQSGPTHFWLHTHKVSHDGGEG